MPEKRIYWTPAQMRESIPHLPKIPITNLDSLVSPIPEPLKHVDVETTILLVVELWGLQRVHHLLKANGSILKSWMALIEDYGWGRVDEESRDLQTTLLLNALKIIATAQTDKFIKQQEIIDGLLKELDISKSIHMKIVDLLILKKQIELPWTIWVNR